ERSWLSTLSPLAESVANYGVYCPSWQPFDKSGHAGLWHTVQRGRRRHLAARSTGRLQFGHISAGSINPRGSRHASTTLDPVRTPVGCERMWTVGQRKV